MERFDIGRVEKARRELRRLVHDGERALIDHLKHVQWLCHQIDPRMDDGEVVEKFTRTIYEADFADLESVTATHDLDRLQAVLEAR